DDIGGRELARAARAATKTCFHLAEEISVEKDLLVRRTIERAHGRLRHTAAAAISGVAEQNDARTGEGLSPLLENLTPAVVDLAENARDHAAHLIRGRPALALRRTAVGLIA